MIRYVAPLALGLLLLSPVLAHADALDGAFMVLQVLAAIWVLALLLMLVSLLAYRQPASRALRGLNYAGIGLSLLLGLVGAVFAGSSGSEALGLGAANPFLRLSLPLAAWLGGASWATFETRPRAREWAVAVAAAGALPTVHTLLSMATSWLPPLGLAFGMAGYVATEVLVLLTGAGIWWVCWSRPSAASRWAGTRYGRCCACRRWLSAWARPAPTSRIWAASICSG